MKTFFLYTLQFIILFIIQIGFLQKIYLTPYCVPFIYISVILTLPVHLKRESVLVIGFFIGWIFDILYDTGGIHAAALTAISYFRYYWLKFLEGTERYGEEYFPSIRLSSPQWFITYISIPVLLHHFLLFFIEAFDLSEILFVLLKTILSTIVSVLFLYFFNLIFYPIKRK